MNRLVIVPALLVAACGTESTPPTDAGPSCATPREECGEACVDTRTSALHCGGCGLACGAGEVCSDGVCGVSCGDGFEECDGLCVDVQMDVRHCGVCGGACPAGRSCEAGSCVRSCSVGHEDCSGSCRDTSTDRRSCGACGMRCEDGEICTAGVCTVSCPSGYESCDGTCRDVQSDEAHCGGCDRPCPAGEVCTAGACQVSCPPTQMLCGGACIDTWNDHENCGACGTVCPAGEVCDEGSCTPTLPIATVPPQTISAAMSCHTNSPTNGRKAGVDEGGTFYAAMICGGEVWVAASNNNGTSWSAAVRTRLIGEQVAVAGGPARTAYLAASGPAGEILFSRSTDGGATWSPSTTLPGMGGMPGPGGSVSLATRGASVWVATLSGMGFTVWRNAAAGMGSFSPVFVPLPAVFGDVLVDPGSGDVWVVSDDPRIHLRRSVDGGATFMPEITLMSEVFFSDWTMSAGQIVAAGAGGGMMMGGGEAWRINAATMTPTPLVTSTTMTQPESRSISADASGAAYTVVVDGMDIVLERALAGTSTFVDRRVLSSSGSAPSVAAVPGSPAALVVFTDGTQVRATTQVF